MTQSPAARALYQDERMAALYVEPPPEYEAIPGVGSSFFDDPPDPDQTETVEDISIMDGMFFFTIYTHSICFFWHTTGADVWEKALPVVHTQRLCSISQLTTRTHDLLRTCPKELDAALATIFPCCVPRCKIFLFLLYKLYNKN